MRIAIISDIHSNIQALTKALSLIDRSNIEKIYCLGDIVGYGANPNECIALVRARTDCCVLGNHDQAASDPSFADHFTKPGRIAAAWTHKTLGQEHLEFLRGLPAIIEADPCTLVHAAPANPEKWEYVDSLESAQRQFAAFATRLCFIGHTHVPSLIGENLKTFVFKPGMRYLINVGSVGQPRDGNPQLSFGILDTDAWTYRNIRADYDIASASRAITAAGLPSALGKRLHQGQ